MRSARPCWKGPEGISSFYRPKRSAQEAIRRAHELLQAGYTDVVDADLSKWFDTIPHPETPAFNVMKIPLP